MREIELLEPGSENIVISYPSLAAACKATGVEWSLALKCCNGLSSEVGGFKWRFKNGLGKDEKYCM